MATTLECNLSHTHHHHHPKNTQPGAYNYAARTLTLAAARHYGWYGTNITITCRLPPDAPAAAAASVAALPYAPLSLPYQELAGGWVGWLVG